MATKKPRLSLYVEDFIVEALQALAAVEHRSVNNMAETLMIEALRSRGVIETPQMPKIMLPEQKSHENPGA